MASLDEEPPASSQTSTQELLLRPHRSHFGLPANATKPPHQSDVELAVAGVRSGRTVRRDGSCGKAMSLSSCHGCVDGPARPPKHVSHGDVHVATGNGVHSGFTVHRNHACGIKHACDALHASAFIDLSLQLGLTCSTRDANQRRFVPTLHTAGKWKGRRWGCFARSMR